MQLAVASVRGGKCESGIAGTMLRGIHVDATRFDHVQNDIMYLSLLCASGYLPNESHNSDRASRNTLTQGSKRVGWRGEPNIVVRGFHGRGVIGRQHRDGSGVIASNLKQGLEMPLSPLVNCQARKRKRATAQMWQSFYGPFPFPSITVELLDAFLPLLLPP